MKKCEFRPSWCGADVPVAEEAIKLAPALRCEHVDVGMVDGVRFVCRRCGRTRAA